MQKLVLSTMGSKTKAKGVARARLVAQRPGLVGWACGRIYTAHLLENGTTDDARKIRAGVIRLAVIAKEVSAALKRSRARGMGLKYDRKLIDELAKVTTRVVEVRRLQNKIFRTNYAFMDTLTVDRLFNLYNNALRLVQEVEILILRGRRNQKAIEDFLRRTNQTKKYGVVFAEDAGTYYLGQLVEVGDLICKKPKKGNRCAKHDITGFKIRVGNGPWSSRKGKPKRHITDMVLPIIPDNHWRKVATGSSGHLEAKTHLARLATINALTSFVAKTRKPLVKSLSKYAARARYPVPF